MLPKHGDIQTVAQLNLILREATILSARCMITIHTGVGIWTLGLCWVDEISRVVCMVPSMSLNFGANNATT